MTDELWARCSSGAFTGSTVVLFTLLLMMTAKFGGAYPTRSLRYTPYAADVGRELAALTVLREMSKRLTVAPPTPQLPTQQPAVLANPLPGAGLPRRSWWWYPELPPPQAKKREDFSSYNWNSFGLRYGK